MATKTKAKSKAGKQTAGKHPPAKKKPPAKPKGKAKAKTAPPDYASEEALTLYDYETQREASLIEAEAELLGAKFLKLKQQSADAKKSFEGRVADLRTWVAERNEGRGKPPKSLFADAE